MLLKLDYLCRKNRTMFLKILILDVHRQKNFGNLKGSTPKEQYDYYEKKYLNNATYVKSLLQEYPELKRLLELKNNSIQRAECEIRKSLYAEKEQIQKIFCDGRKFSGTVGIYMSKGDIHRGGRSVAKVELDNGHWNLRSGGIYLYDGISGIVLFLAKYLHDFEEKNASAEEIYHLAVLRLKAYTDEIHKKQIYDKNLLTGIVNGESSVVYTYLYLFKLTGKRVWMIYAEKHFSIIERVWKEDSQLDYLSGNAGAIVVAVMLYKETGNLKYYEIAADMEKDLWKKGQETGNGYGWRLKGTDGPLAGMSHGNSGFLMAYAALYECNHKAEYADKIQLLLRYEDSLYSEKAGNWKDLRESSGESFMNAWCHGAPGILLSRMKLEELFPEDMQIKKDRLNAADSLFYGEQDEKICLCHGMSGNLLIMKKYLRKYGNKKMKEQYEALCDCLLFQLDHPAKISGTEYLNLAFMNGISGTGMALMEIL